MRRNLIEVLRIGTHLGFQEVKQINRRSRLGQWWITLGTASLIGTIGFVFGLIFRVDLHSYLPYLAIGIVFWNYFSGHVTESSIVLISSGSLLKQLTLSPWIYATKVSTKMLLLLGHNLVIIPVVLIVSGNAPTPRILLLLLALPIILMTMNAFGIMVAMFSLRFRDVPPMIGSILNIVFYLTPIMWLAEAIKSSLAHFLLGLNPIYHLVQIFRLPLLGQSPTLENWLITTTLCMLLNVVAFVAVKKFRARLVFWL